MGDKIYCTCCGEEIEDGQEYFIVDRKYTYCSNECIDAMDDSDGDIKRYHKDYE